MTCVIVDAETPAGVVSAATTAPSMSNLLTVHLPFRSRSPLPTGSRMCAALSTSASRSETTFWQLHPARIASRAGRDVQVTATLRQINQRPLQGEVGATGCVERRSEGEVHEPRAREDAEEAQRSLSEHVHARRLCGGVRSWEHEHRREELADVDADKSDEE